MNCIALGLEHKDIIAALHREAFEEHWSGDDFANLITIPASFGWLAVRADDPVGFVLCQGDEVEAEIITIATQTTARRQGVASCLLRNIFAQTGRLFLEVGEDNTAAKTFYNAFGFSQIGRRKDYYKRESGTVDALVMSMERKDLAGLIFSE